MIGLRCDGDPAKQAWQLQFEEVALPPHDQLYSDDIFLSFGGFHTELKILKANGGLFDEDLLKEMLLAWRNTTDNVKYILFPKNPTQRKE